jgi:hypothetical protein
MVQGLDPSWTVLVNGANDCRIEEAKQSRKQEEKRQKTEHLEQRRQDIQKMLEAMTEEERENWKKEQQVGCRAMQYTVQFAFSALVFLVPFLGLVEACDLGMNTWMLNQAGN